MSSKSCTSVTPLCPVEATTYGYYPNLGGNVFFIVIYAICGIAQIYFSVRFRSWTFGVALIFGAFLEMAGYIGRVLMNSNPWDGGAFKLQIVTLILAPSFVAAGIYLTLKHIILNLGSQYSRLKPRLFTWIFIGCDIISLFLQAAGGGVAASAEDDIDMTDMGNNIIIAGIVFQVVTMSVCAVLAVDFFMRFFRHGSAAFRAMKPMRLDTIRGERDDENACDQTADEHGDHALSGETGDARANTSWTHLKIVITAEIVAYFTVLIRCIYR